jgi:hypothetical protein
MTKWKYVQHMYNYKNFGLNNAAHDLVLSKSLETKAIASSLYGKHAVRGYVYRLSLPRFRNGVGS